MDLGELLTDRRTLLVEGDPWIRDSLAQFLRDKGCRVLALEDIPSGYIALDENRFDVVICDHGSPGIDCLKYLALARSLLPDAILILLTGDGAEAVRPAAELAGIDEVIGKPFTVEIMERSILRALARVAGSWRRSSQTT